MTIPDVRAEMIVLMANAEQARNGAKEMISGLDKMIANLKRLIGDDSDMWIAEIGKQLALSLEGTKDALKDHPGSS